MSHHRRSQARRQRAIERRRKADAEHRREVVERANELLARNDDFAWRPWGYLLPERDCIDTPTGYYPVVDYVLDHEFQGPR